MYLWLWRCKFLQSPPGGNGDAGIDVHLSKGPMLGTRPRPSWRAAGWSAMRRGRQDPSGGRMSPARGPERHPCVAVNEFTSAGSASVQSGFEAFQAAVSETCGPVAVSPVDVTAFRGRVLSASIGAVQLSNVAVSGDVTVRRTPQLIERAADEYFKVGVQLRGRSVVSQDDREAVLTSGDYAVWDTTRPYALNRNGTNEMLVVMFPREMISLSPQRLSGLTARRISRRHGLAASVSPFLVELGKRVHSLNHSGGLYLADAVLDMLASSFAEQLSRGEPVEAGGSGWYLRVRAHIEQRLADPDLTVPTVAAANHISVRYLQKLFEAEGETATGWIRARRLAHCRRDLADPQFAQLPVSSIAARWGLVNAAHFSRLFKSAYGLSPTEFRAQALWSEDIRHLPSALH
jgi:AraC-like DNA-binding protein